MQWTLHKGSLQKALAFIRNRLTGDGRGSIWPELFPDLDIRDNQIVYRGEVVTTKNNRRLREIFRGSPNRDEYDTKTASRWAALFAKAGRHPVIQRLQTDYARAEVDELLAKSMGIILAAYKRICERNPRGGTWAYVCPRLSETRETYRSRYGKVSDYAGKNLKAVTLFFGMKVNNPAGAFVHLKQVIDTLASQYGSYSIGRWPAGWEAALGDEFERVLRGSTFAAWGDAKARKARRLSRTEKLLREFKKLTS